MITQVSIPTMVAFSSEYGRFSEGDQISQRELLPIRLTTKIYPPNGADITCMASTPKGLFYCKMDKGDGRPVRSQEAFCYLLASAVGIAVPNFAPVEDPETGDIYFGSLQHFSTSLDIERDRIIRFGLVSDGPKIEWLGRYFSALAPFDLLNGNWDRRNSNFILHQSGTAKRLCAIDFGAANLAFDVPINLSVADSPTNALRRQNAMRHGFYVDAAQDMCARLKNIKPSQIKAFFNQMHPDWVHLGQEEKLYGLWASGSISARLDEICAVLTNGSHI